MAKKPRSGLGEGGATGLKFTIPKSPLWETLLMIWKMVKLPHSGFEGDIIGLKIPYSHERTVGNSLADLKNTAW